MCTVTERFGRSRLMTTWKRVCKALFRLHGRCRRNYPFASLRVLLWRYVDCSGAGLLYGWGPVVCSGFSIARLRKDGISKDTVPYEL